MAARQRYTFDDYDAGRIDAKKWLDDLINEVDELGVSVQFGYGPQSGWEVVGIFTAADHLKMVRKHLGRIYSNQKWVCGQEPVSREEAVKQNESQRQAAFKYLQDRGLVPPNARLVSSIDNDLHTLAYESSTP